MQVVTECLEGEWRPRRDGRLRFIGRVRATQYLRGQVFNDWNEEWVEWIAPTEDYHPGGNPMPAVGISRDPATAVAEGPLVEPDRELAPVGSPAPREVVDLYSSECSVIGLSRRSRHR